MNINESFFSQMKSPMSNIRHFEDQPVNRETHLEVLNDVFPYVAELKKEPRSRESWACTWVEVKLPIFVCVVKQLYIYIYSFIYLFIYLYMYMHMIIYSNRYGIFGGLSPQEKQTLPYLTTSSCVIFCLVANRQPMSIAGHSKALAVVEKYKHHPAILLWGFGNEKNYYVPWQIPLALER